MRFSANLRKSGRPENNEEMGLDIHLYLDWVPDLETKVIKIDEHVHIA